MNLVQHFIVEVHSVEDVTEKCKFATEPMVEVDITVNCFGVIKRNKEVFGEYTWNAVKEKGWYLG